MKIIHIIVICICLQLIYCKQHANIKPIKAIITNCNNVSMIPKKLKRIKVKPPLIKSFHTLKRKLRFKIWALKYLIGKPSSNCTIHLTFMIKRGIVSSLSMKGSCSKFFTAKIKHQLLFWRFRSNKSLPVRLTIRFVK